MPAMISRVKGLRCTRAGEISSARHSGTARSREGSNVARVDTFGRTVLIPRRSRQSVTKGPFGAHCNSINTPALQPDLG